MQCFELNSKGTAIHRSVQIVSAMAEESIESQWRSSERCGDALISKGKEEKRSATAKTSKATSGNDVKAKA